MEPYKAMVIIIMGCSQLQTTELLQDLHDAQCELGRGHYNDDLAEVTTD